MARDDECDGILSQGLSDGPGGGRPARGPGKLAIGHGLSHRDLSSGLVHPPGKRGRSVQVKEVVLKILNLPLKVLAYSLDDLGNPRRRDARVARAGLLLDS